MKGKEINQNVQLGTFVLAGVILFIISVFYIGSENNIFNKTFTVFAAFKNVEGLKRGDNVWLSGVKVGTVEEVRIVREGEVIVNLSLKDKQNAFIKKDATAFIGSDGLVGNKIVVIRPGKSPYAIDDYDTINALSPTDTQDLINIAKDIGENTRTLTNDLKTIADKINKGEGIVGELLNNGELAQDIRQTVANLKRTGASTAKASSELTALLEEMKNGDGLLPTLISDTAYAATFQDALQNVKKVSQNSAAIAANLDKVITKVNDNDNALGVILTDTTFASNLKNTIENAESASHKLDENMEALQHNFLFRGYFRKKNK